MLGLIFTKPMLAHTYICFDIILSASTKFIPSHLHLELKSPFKYAPYTEKTFEGHGLQITLTLFATTEPTSANEVPDFAHTSVFKASRNMVGHNQEFFFNLAVSKVWWFFPILKNFFSSYSFLSPKFSLFCHHSSKIQTKQVKKNTGHNFTT
jgi:hypothetical protein